MFDNHTNIFAIIIIYSSISAEKVFILILKLTIYIIYVIMYSIGSYTRKKSARKKSLKMYIFKVRMLDG